MHHRELLIAIPKIGPYHACRVRALRHAAANAGVRLFVIEIATRSTTYPFWGEERSPEADVTVFGDGTYEELPAAAIWRRLGQLVPRRRPATILTTGYAAPDAVALLAIGRAVGADLLVMTDSKFDDSPRSVLKESLKSLLVRHFNGAIAAGPRTVDYLRFLGLRGPVATPYDVTCVDHRPSSPRPDGPFVAVSRMVDRKGLDRVLDAYDVYASAATRSARRLLIAGDGPTRAKLEARAAAIDGSSIEFLGSLTPEQVADLLDQAFCLVHLPRQEQWGLIVNEAMAAGCLVVIDQAAGVADVAGASSGVITAPSAATADSTAALFRRIDELPLEQRVSWAESNVAFVREHLSPGRFADSVISLVNDLRHTTD